MNPCQRSGPVTTRTTRVSLSVDLEPHSMIERLATNMLFSVLGEIAADGFRATNIAVTIDSYHPVHDWID